MKLKSQNPSNVVWAYLLLGCLIWMSVSFLNSNGAHLKTGFNAHPDIELTEHSDPVSDLADAKAKGDDSFRAVAEITDSQRPQDSEIHIPGVTRQQADSIIDSHNYSLVNSTGIVDTPAKTKLHELDIAYAAKYNTLLQNSTGAALGSTPRSP